MDVCCTSGCALAQHKCDAALFRAKCSPHCSVLLCKTGSQQAVFHCSHTYGDLLYIRVCNDPAPMHCNTGQGKMQTPLFSDALQNRLTAGSVALHLHLWRLGAIAVTQACCEPVVQCTTDQWGLHFAQTNAAVHFCWLTAQLYEEPISSSGQNAVSTVQCCYAKQAHSRQSFTAVTPMCWVTAQLFQEQIAKCSAALFRAKCTQHCSVRLCKTGSQQAVFHCSYT